jgi:hypothetical protein
MNFLKGNHFYDYWQVRKWVRFAMTVRKKKEDRLKKIFYAIPWTSIGLFIVFMIFFGIDFGAGMATQIRLLQNLNNKENKKMLEAKKEEAEKKAWTLGAMKDAREGRLQQPLS